MTTASSMQQTPRDKEYTSGCQDGWGLHEGWIGNLGLADGSYYTQNGLTTRSYHRTEGTTFSIL